MHWGVVFINLVLVCMGLRWAPLLITRKDIAVVTGAPVRQLFSHESNIYRMIKMATT